jgi:Cytochrome c2
MLNKKVGLALAAMLLAPVAATAADAPPTAFNQCKACHKVEAGKHGVGPSLFGVYGAAAGHAEGYKYSEKHKASGLVWDDANLAKYLSDPKGTIPGNKMAYAGLKKPEDLQAVIEYLKTLK